MKFAIRSTLIAWLVVCCLANTPTGIVSRALQSTVDGDLLDAAAAKGLDRFLLLIDFTLERDVLRQPTNSLTLFAPINESLQDEQFQRLLWLTYRKRHLPDFVRAHIVETALATDMFDDTILTKSFEVVHVSRSSQNNMTTLSNGQQNSSIIETVSALNGYLHVIDRPILPSWMSWHVAQVAPLAGYSLFPRLLVATTLYEEVSTSRQNDYTFVVPLNTAIQALPDGVWERVEDTPEYAEDLVRAHFVDGVYGAQDLAVVASLTTKYDHVRWNVESDSMTNELKINDNRLVQVDILAYNGIVHAMDGIILPNGGPPTQSPSTVPPPRSPTSFSTEFPTTAFPTTNLPSDPTSNADTIISGFDFMVVFLLMASMMFLTA